MALSVFETSSSARIRRGTLHGEVAERLRDMIDSGQLSPGQRIPEGALCEQLGISRTPLREALKVLMAEGLVDLIPNKGASVAQLTEKHVNDIVDILSELEALVGRLASERAGENDIDDLDTAFQDIVNHNDEDDLEATLAAVWAFHERMLEAARNETLVQAFHGLQARLRRAHHRVVLSDDERQSCVDDHRAILKAMRQRDGAKVSDLMRSHLLNLREGLKAQLPTLVRTN